MRHGRRDDRMKVGEADQEFDPDRILGALERHGVAYVLVGGVAARAHGASRTTSDIDCVAASDEANLERLAAAMVELGSRLRVSGLSDEEARALPLVLDAKTLSAFGTSTWNTDAGPLDVLRELRDRSGRSVGFDELDERATSIIIGDVTVRLASLEDIIAAKEFAGREKDQEALLELRSLRDEHRD